MLLILKIKYPFFLIVLSLEGQRGGKSKGIMFWVKRLIINSGGELGFRGLSFKPSAGRSCSVLFEQVGEWIQQLSKRLLSSTPRTVWGRACPHLRNSPPSLRPRRALWGSWTPGLTVSPISLIMGNRLHSASLTDPEFRWADEQLLIRDGRGARPGRNSQEHPWG